MCLLPKEDARVPKFYLKCSVKWLGGNVWLVEYLLNGGGGTVLCICDSLG